MAQTLNLQSFGGQNRLAQSNLTSDAAASVTSLPVSNNVNFLDGGYVLVGDVGSPTAEMKTATSTTAGTSIPLSSATVLPHSFGETVTLLFGNQINIYRANDVYGTGVQPPDADFDKIGTVDITANSDLTSYTDAGGTTGQWYKYTYYNSTTTYETQLSASRAVQAGAVHYVSLDQVRGAAGFSNNPNVTDDIVAEKRTAAELEINGALTALYSFPLPQPTNQIIVNLAKELAGGMLMEEMYTGVNPAMADQGALKAAQARMGGGKITSLGDLRNRSVVLEDANYLELVTDEGQGVRGWPDETTAVSSEVGGTQEDGTFEYTPLASGYDYGPQATIEEVF